MAERLASCSGGNGLKSRPRDRLSEEFRGFPQSSQESAGIVPKSRPRLLPSTRFPTNHSLFIVPTGAIQSEPPTATLNKIQINKTNIDFPHPPVCLTDETYREIR